MITSFILGLFQTLKLVAQGMEENFILQQLHIIGQCQLRYELHSHNYHFKILVICKVECFSGFQRP